MRAIRRRVRRIVSVPRPMGALEKRLRAERHQVLQALVAESTQGSELVEGWQERDSAAEDGLREMEFGHVEALRLRLRQTDEALGRLKAGTYGMCLTCGRKINERRLAIDPAISRCLRCQEEAEG